jgi:hypothetical protein
MPVTMRPISVSESSGKARPMFAPSMFRDAEARANAARQRTAEGGSAIERQ